MTQPVIASIIWIGLQAEHRRPYLTEMQTSPLSKRTSGSSSLALRTILHLRDANHVMKIAWDLVSKTTIANCFWRCLFQRILNATCLSASCNPSCSTASSKRTLQWSNHVVISSSVDWDDIFTQVDGKDKAADASADDDDEAGPTRMNSTPHRTSDWISSNHHDIKWRSNERWLPRRAFENVWYPRCTERVIKAIQIVL